MKNANGSVTSNVATVKVTTGLITQGGLRREIYRSITGNTIDDFTRSPQYPNSPDRIDTVSSFGSRDVGPDCGTRLTGFVTPTATGSYVFYIAADDQAELYGSPNDNPSDKPRIAFEPQWAQYRDYLGTARRTASRPENKSAAVNMEAGRSYYVEAPHKNGGGGDYISVAWQRPSASPPVNGSAPIAGTFLSWGMFAPEITGQPKSATVPAGGTATFTVTATGTTPLNYQRHRNGVKIDGAPKATLTINDVAAAHAGSYTVVVSNQTRAVTSQPAVLTVGEPSGGRAFVVRELPSGYVPGAGFKLILKAAPPNGTSVYAIEEFPPANWNIGSISDSGSFDTATKKVKFGPYFDSNTRTLSYEVIPPNSETGRKTFTGTASADGINSAAEGASVIELMPLLHPADNSPANNRISIGEVTAYGAAWRNGTTWPVAPDPIPIDYVTRAGALWKSGEAYVFDSKVPRAPLWWVNAPTPRLAGVVRSASFTASMNGHSTAVGAKRLERVKLAPAFRARRSMPKRRQAGRNPSRWRVMGGGAEELAARKMSW